MTVASPLEAHLGYWLRYVSNHVSHAFSRKLEAQGVTVAEWVLLRELHEAPGALPSRLAERLGMTRGAISKLAERLMAKSLVERVPGGPDRRLRALALTPTGCGLVPALCALADANDAEFFGDLPADDRATIERAMKEIVRRRGLRAVPID